MRKEPKHDSTAFTVFDRGRMAYLTGARCNDLATHTERMGWCAELDEHGAHDEDELTAQHIHGRATRR